MTEDKLQKWYRDLIELLEKQIDRKLNETEEYNFMHQSLMMMECISHSIYEERDIDGIIEFLNKDLSKVNNE